MRAVGYVRVSTKDQVRDGVSLDAQQAKLEAYCLVKDRTLSPSCGTKATRRSTSSGRAWRRGSA